MAPKAMVSTKAVTTGRQPIRMVCLEKSQRCVLILANDVRAEAGFAQWSVSSLETPAFPTTGNMETTQESPEPE